MNKPLSEQNKAKPLRFVEPAYYRMLLEQLEAYHLHPFDVHASVITEGKCLTISVRYGDGLVQKSHTFFCEDANGLEAELAGFFREIAEDCKKTLIADYYKIMKV